MADPLSRTDPVGLVRARLCTRFPDNAAEVNRQIDLAMACADHLDITMTPEGLENLVLEQLAGRAASRRSASRTSPAIPLIHHPSF